VSSPRFAPRLHRQGRKRIVFGTSVLTPFYRADVHNVGKFDLPDAAGRAGGACTSALLQVLYRGGHVAGAMSWVQCLRSMRTELNRMGFDQVPQLTSSRLIDVNETMHIVPPGSTGRRRAILM